MSIPFADGPGATCRTDIVLTFEVSESSSDVCSVSTEPLKMYPRRAWSAKARQWMAKYWTTEMAMRVADQCLQLHGGYGYCEEYPIARAWRDTRVMSIFAGTNEIMKTIAAKFMGL